MRQIAQQQTRFNALEELLQLGNRLDYMLLVVVVLNFGVRVESVHFSLFEFSDRIRDYTLKVRKRFKKNNFSLKIKSSMIFEKQAKK